MFLNIDKNKKLLISAILSLFVPVTYFTATRYDVNLFVISSILKISAITFFLSIGTSFIIKKVTKYDFLTTLSSTLFFLLIFFS